ncbi:MAG: Gfo/Idh/MocA family oxidoreductase [Phycisphaeraceae bacterium]|nr:Gfo/Idh/MocA family oxidoreductase [Phycisphaeraceae bacterium]
MSNSTTRSTSPIGMAVIGCGALAQGQHLPNIADNPRMSLEVACDVSDATLELCRAKFGAKRVVKDFTQAIRDPAVQVVVVATTEKLRLPVLRACVEAGKPVYCEKPIAPTLEELYEVHKLLTHAKLPFCAGHNRRSAPAMLDAHRIFRQHMTAPKLCPWRWDREGDKRPKLAEDGAAGISVRINDDWHSWKNWVFSPDQNAFGAMLFEMTHFTDICNWMLASKPVKVAAMEANFLSHGVVITYANGEIATILMCANGSFGYPKELYEMMGQGGVVAVDHMVELRTAGIEGEVPRVAYPMLRDRHPEVGLEGGISGWLAKKQVACSQAADKRDPMLQFTAEPDKGHARQLERFLDQVFLGGPEVCGINDALLATRVSFAAIRASKLGRVVHIDEV